MDEEILQTAARELGIAPEAVEERVVPVPEIQGWYFHSDEPAVFSLVIGGDGSMLKAPYFIPFERHLGEFLDYHLT